MTRTSPPALVTTRHSWHLVAEHVLAAGQFAASGTVRLRPHPGGLATTAGVGGRQLAVVGDRLVVTDGGTRHQHPLTTLGRAAEDAGVALGLRGSYAPATVPDPDAPLPVDAAAAHRLAGWYALGDTALRRLTAGLGAPAEPVLWPEHLDLALTVDAVNLGVSPGDDATPEPYLYVGPHEGPTSGDPFWNAPFGALVGADRIRTPDDAVAAFSAGRDRALTDRSRT
ncbi:hypothetical protein SAMN05660690_2237 [Geodermatophilus telluris]|uniref:Uncharacterized protein n=1 Tax=Geodermatophilus telluris TaxID=1190417 RepID=A0A1G6NUN7_9ACTN|nr:hypothetical protein [Geodermatophilus telluris]SDC71361.1 hypothetical protein SAMN05660690_2237 [Geodermatophilus telluris]